MKGTDEMIIVALSNKSQMNDGARKGGFAPSQWALGKFPRNSGNNNIEEEFADLGVISAEIDPDVAFYETDTDQIGMPWSFCRGGLHPQSTQTACEKSSNSKRKVLSGRLDRV